MPCHPGLRSLSLSKGRVSFLELRDKFPGGGCCPHLAVVAGVVCVFTVECAPLHGEARVDSLVVVANVLAAGVFLRLFAPGVGEVAVGVRFSVVLQDPVAGTAAELGRTKFVSHADSPHPGDGESLVLGQVNHLVHRCKYHHATQAVLEILCKGVTEHGAEAEPDGEHARCIDAEVLVQVGEEFVKEDVVLVVPASPWIFCFFPGSICFSRVSVRRDEDGVLLGA